MERAKKLRMEVEKSSLKNTNEGGLSDQTSTYAMSWLIHSVIYIDYW